MTDNHSGCNNVACCNSCIVPTSPLSLCSLLRLRLKFIRHSFHSHNICVMSQGGGTPPMVVTTPPDRCDSALWYCRIFVFFQRICDWMTVSREEKFCTFPETFYFHANFWTLKVEHWLFASHPVGYFAHHCFKYILYFLFFWN